MTKKLLFPIILFLTSLVHAQNVNIPDANFKNALVSNSLINTDANTEISLTEAASYNGYITVTSLGITDLTGIEAFTGTIYLDCAGNSITTLDLSANTGLTNILHLDYNPLTSVIFPPTSNVTLLHINNTPIASIDISPLQTMTNLYAMNCTSLTSLDVTGNPNLIVLNIELTAMTTIDLTGMVNLQALAATQSNITGTLDLSPCTSLIYLSCFYSDFITEINMQNGNNMSVGPGDFDATDCPSLTCVQVDNVAFANAVWSTAVDPGVIFSLDCSTTTILATSITIQGQGGVSTITTAGGTLQMESTILPSTANQTAVWGIASGGAFATIDVNGLLTATNNGTVTVGAMTTDGSNLYTTTDIVITGQTSGIEESSETTFLLYPNPTNLNLTISTTETINTIHIYTASGKLIQTETENTFSVEQLPAGIYFIEVQTANSISKTRFIKE